MLVGHLRPIQLLVFFLGKVGITLKVTYNELRPYIPLCTSMLEGCGYCWREVLTWIEMVDSKPANPCRETFIEPELIPPIHCHKVAKPLVGQFYPESLE